MGGGRRGGGVEGRWVSTGGGDAGSGGGVRDRWTWVR